MENCFERMFKFFDILSKQGALDKAVYDKVGQ